MNPGVPAMQPSAPAGAGPAVPRIEDNLVQASPLIGDDLPPIPPAADTALLPAPKPWYRRRKPLIAVVAAVAVLLGGLAAALVLTVFASHGPDTPAAQLRADGYPVTMTVDPSKMGSIDPADFNALKPYVATMVIGVKGSNAEIVYGLTDVGKAEAQASPPPVSANLGQGAVMHYRDGFVIIDTPASALNIPGASAQAS